MFSEVFNNFLSLLYSTAKCKVIGKRISRRAGYGLEAPMETIAPLNGHKNA